MKKRGLGRGLEALLGDAPKGSEPTARATPTDQLTAGEFQPRRHFATTEMATLADSVRQHGVLQPILARPATDGRLEIVAGERRWRAARMVGLATVPVVVRDIADNDARLFALIENLQRADLNPMEQADGLARLVADSRLTHAEAGEKVGLSRSAVSNLLRLRELAGGARKLLTNGDLEMGQARALLALPKESQEAFAKRAAREAWTVRETERKIREFLKTGQRGTRRDFDGISSHDSGADAKLLERELSARLALRVEIRHRADGGGKMVLHYGNLDALDKALKKLRQI